MTTASPITAAAGLCSLQRFVGRRGVAELYCADCRDLLPLPCDYVVSDPPYGIAYDATHDKYRNGVAREECEWDVEAYDPKPILALGKPTILWGGNCYASRLPDHAGWLCWVKTVRDGAEVRQADMELAWTNCVRRSQTIRHLWIGAYRDSESGQRNQHPTQKPVRVMAWCLDVAKIPEGKTVLDPYMGSGTTGIACLRTGRNFIGIERDKRHFETACNRISREIEGELL